MADNFDLDDFLSNYEPKKVDLSKYLKTKKLRGYHEMTDKSELIEGRTRVRFIKISDAFSDKNYDRHISYPAIFDHGLKHTKKGLDEVDDSSQWTHIVVVFFPEDGIIEKKEIRNRVFRIRISNYHIFYKYL